MPFFPCHYPVSCVPRPGDKQMGLAGAEQSPSPVLLPGDRTIRRQTQHLGLRPVRPLTRSYGQYFPTDTDPSKLVTEGVSLLYFTRWCVSSCLLCEQLITEDKLMWKVSFWVHLAVYGRPKFTSARSLHLSVAPGWLSEILHLIKYNNGYLACKAHFTVVK